jgi:hypothetical protein
MHKYHAVKVLGGVWKEKHVQYIQANTVPFLPPYFVPINKPNYIVEHDQATPIL